MHGGPVFGFPNRFADGVTAVAIACFLDGLVRRAANIAVAGFVNRFANGVNTFFVASFVTGLANFVADITVAS